MGRIIAAQGAPEQGAVWSRSNRAGRTTRPRMSWNATPESERRASPQIAALLTWIVPGAGHLYLGRPMLALLGFLLIEGLYLVGLNLSHGMLLEYLEPDLRGPFAGALTPEVGNLGMLVYQTKQFGFGDGAPRVWPEAMRLGVWLTAVQRLAQRSLDRARLHRSLSAQERAPEALPDRPGCARVGPPGLGHVLQRRYLRGAIVFSTLIALFVVGSLLCEGSNLDRERHFYYWAGQFLLGAPAWIAEGLHGNSLVKSEIPYVDCGLGMTCVAGLLNVLAMLDVLNRAEELEQPEGAPPASQPLAMPQTGTLA